MEALIPLDAVEKIGVCTICGKTFSALLRVPLDRITFRLICQLARQGKLNALEVPA